MVDDEKKGKPKAPEPVGPIPTAPPPSPSIEPEASGAAADDYEQKQDSQEVPEDNLKEEEKKKKEKEKGKTGSHFIDSNMETLESFNKVATGMKEVFADLVKMHGPTVADKLNSIVNERQEARAAKASAEKGTEAKADLGAMGTSPSASEPEVNTTVADIASASAEKSAEAAKRLEQEIEHTASTPGPK